MASKRVTFDDIARYTHFSKTTISRFFNNPSSLTPKNQVSARKDAVQFFPKGRLPLRGVVGAQKLGGGVPRDDLEGKEGCKRYREQCHNESR